MIKFNTLVILILATMLLLMTTCGGKEPSASDYADEGMALRKVTLANEDKATTPGAKYPDVMPGQGNTITRSFENAPPMIPHSIKNFTPIKKGANMCMGCHNPKVAQSSGATPLPKSHLVDMRSGKDLNGELDQARFACTMCHASQATIDPPVKNNFVPEFRNKKDKTSSNLMEKLHEGTK